MRRVTLADINGLAKSIRVSNPNMSWQDALKEASAGLKGDSDSESSFFVSVIDEPPVYYPHNSTFEMTDRVLLADTKAGVRSGFIRRYVMDVRSPAFTANTGDLFFTTETDEMLTSVVGWAPMPEL